MGAGGGTLARDGADRLADGRFLVRLPLESVAALGEAVRGLRRVASQRRALQAARTAGDGEILPHFGRAMECLSSRKSYISAQDALVARFGLDGLFRSRTRVLLITHDPLRANMSGPGVRVLELGRALAADCDVTIATPFEPEVRDDRCRVAQYALGTPSSMEPLAENADVVVVQGFTLSRFPILTRVPAQIVVDLYCPFTIEHLEMRTSAVHHAPGSASALPIPEIHDEAVGILDVQNAQLGLGDFFICASERQRDFWVGALQTAGRLNALTYGSDPSLRSLIDVVPFGLPDAPPPAEGAPRDQGRAARHRRGRPGDPVGGLAPRLAGPAGAGARGGAACAGRTRARSSSSWARDTRIPTCRCSAPSRRASPSHATSACSTATSSSTPGCPTPSATSGCSRPTSACPRTAITSKRASRTARACSTTSGRRCRWSARVATCSPNSSSPSASG